MFPDIIVHLKFHLKQDIHIYVAYSRQTAGLNGQNFLWKLMDGRGGGGNDVKKSKLFLYKFCLLFFSTSASDI